MHPPLQVESANEIMDYELMFLYPTLIINIKVH